MSPVGVDPVGFVGLGNMGTPMARCLRQAGIELVVFDTRAEVADEFARENGAIRVSSAGELFAAAGTVITMLPDGAIVRQVVTDGLAGSERAHGLVVDMSSSAPAQTTALAALLAERGYRLVDAPVSGGVARAVTGELSILVGGDEESVGECRPLFDAMGSVTFHVGPVGSGHAMKALNNLMSATGLLVAAETLLIGRKYGLDPRVMLAVLNASTGGNQATRTKFEPFVLSGSYASGFALDLMVKDLATAAELARSAGTPFLVSALATNLWQVARGQLPAHSDQMRLVQWLEDLAGVRLADPA